MDCLSRKKNEVRLNRLRRFKLVFFILSEYINKKWLVQRLLLLIRVVLIL